MELPAEIGALGEVKCLLCLGQVGHDVPVEHPGRESKDSWIYSFQFRRVSRPRIQKCTGGSGWGGPGGGPEGHQPEKRATQIGRRKTRFGSLL